MSLKNTPKTGCFTFKTYRFGGYMAVPALLKARQTQPWWLLKPDLQVPARHFVDGRRKFRQIGLQSAVVTVSNSKVLEAQSVRQNQR